MFEEFQKIARLRRGCVVTEKIDGTNGQIYIPDTYDSPDWPRVDGVPVPFLVGSRSRWLEPGKQDNFGFAAWAHANYEELLKLGPGRHFGEWWGAGIQRRYGLTEKRFSLFNVARWGDFRDREKFPKNRPACCSVVPVLWAGIFDTDDINDAIASLRVLGSAAAPGFMKPEGVVIYHEAARQLFKQTLEKDDEPKSVRA